MSFARSGPKGIVLVARSSEALAEVTKEIHEINKNIQVLAVSTDLSDSKSVAALWEKVKATFGHADVLINNAGILNGGAVKDIPEDSWWSDFVRFHPEAIIPLLNVNRRLMCEELSSTRRDFWGFSARRKGQSSISQPAPL